MLVERVRIACGYAEPAIKISKDGHKAVYTRQKVMKTKAGMRRMRRKACAMPCNGGGKERWPCLLKDSFREPMIKKNLFEHSGSRLHISACLHHPSSSILNHVHSRAVILIPTISRSSPRAGEGCCAMMCVCVNGMCRICRRFFFRFMWTTLSRCASTSSWEHC